MGEELFNAKRRANTETSLTREVKRRKWVLSDALIDEVIHRECWETGHALLCLPELDEELAVKLLAARIEFLPKVVQRVSDQHLLEKALRSHLPTSSLPGVLEDLVEWIEAYHESGEKEVYRVAPGLPKLQDILVFMSALAGGCAPALALLEPDLLERVLEALGGVQTEIT